MLLFRFIFICNRRLCFPEKAKLPVVRFVKRFVYYIGRTSVKNTWDPLWIKTVVDAIIAKAKDWLNLSPKERKKQGKDKAKGEDKAAEGGGSEVMPIQKETNGSYADAPNIKEHLKKQEEEFYKKPEDKRDDAQKLADFLKVRDKSIKIVTNPKLNHDDIVIGVDQLWHKYNMDNAAANLVEEKQGEEIWFLKIELGDNRFALPVRRTLKK